MGEIFLFTEDGFKKIELEIKNLEKQLNELVLQKGEAAETGGNAWHDNFCFEEICRQETLLRNHLDTIKDIKANAQIVQQTNNNETATIGCRVKYQIDNGIIQECKLVGYGEADLEKNHISYNSPLGSAIMNAKKGEVKEYCCEEFKKNIKIIDIF